MLEQTPQNPLPVEAAPLVDDTHVDFHKKSGDNIIDLDIVRARRAAGKALEQASTPEYTKEAKIYNFGKKLGEVRSAEEQSIEEIKPAA